MKRRSFARMLVDASEGEMFNPKRRCQMKRRLFLSALAGAAVLAAFSAVAHAQQTVKIGLL